jgi:hypothetical protein
LVVTSDAFNGPLAASLSGTGSPIGVVSLSAPSLSFAEQKLGTSSRPHTLTLTNTGSAALGLSGASAIVATGDFSQTNNCGTSLGIGAFCNISVRFTPTVLGPRNGAITIASNAAGSPHSAALSGTGAAHSRVDLTPILMLLLD